MNIAGDLEFAHRLNADGTFDSICMSCFLTIGSAESDPALEAQEKMHRCNGHANPVSLAAKNDAATDH